MTVLSFANAFEARGPLPNRESGCGGPDVVVAFPARQAREPDANNGLLDSAGIHLLVDDDNWHDWPFDQSATDLKL